MIQTSSAQPRASSEPASDLIEQLERVLRRKAAADPEVAILLELAAGWLGNIAFESRAGDTPSLSAVVMDSHAPIAAGDPASALVEPKGGASTPDVPVHASVPAPSVAPMLRPLAPIEVMSPQAADLPPTPESIAALVRSFGKPMVSPRIAPTVTPPTRLLDESPHRTIEDLRFVAKRMALKVRACEWAIERYEAGMDFSSVKPGYEELRATAGTMQPCYLWMLEKSTAQIRPEDWRQLAGCYQACAVVLECILEYPDHYQSDDTLLLLLGETQSAILAAIIAAGSPEIGTDRDQHQVFEWCRDEGDARRCFNQFLTLNHLADPSTHAGMKARAERLRDTLRSRKDREKVRRRGLNTIRYHAGQLLDGGENSQHHWLRIGEGIDDALAAGTPASLPELVEMLIPVVDDIPEEVWDRQGTRQVLRYVDERIAQQQASEQEERPAPRPTTPEMLKVRQALRGSVVVLVGGDSRRHSKDAIEREFELAELKWISSKEHTSLTTFTPAIEDPETRLVMVMTRWSSHAYEDLQEIAERSGKVFVRLPRGYNPSQMAHEIAAQASEQLGME
jgi:hypothetical protein